MKISNQMNIKKTMDKIKKPMIINSTITTNKLI